MLKKAFYVPGVALAVFFLFAFPALAGQKNVSLADFNGVWQMDAEKSKPLTKNAAGKLKDLVGFKMTVNAKAKTLRMEWPGHQPKVRKITAVKADGQALSCKIEGYKTEMLLEQVTGDEMLVKDREEALVFVRLK